MKDLDLSIEKLNETVVAWLKAVDKNILRDFGESRNGLKPEPGAGNVFFS